MYKQGAQTEQIHNMDTTKQKEIKKIIYNFKLSNGKL